ncbi:MAG: hypothetical protein WCJ21_11555 [Planctomycetota bacterium]
MADPPALNTSTFSPIGSRMERSSPPFAATATPAQSPWVATSFRFGPVPLAVVSPPWPSVTVDPAYANFRCRA